MYALLAVGAGITVLGLILAKNKRVFKYNVRQRKKLYLAFGQDDMDTKVRREQQIIAWLFVIAGLGIMGFGIWVVVR